MDNSQSSAAAIPPAAAPEDLRCGLARRHLPCRFLYDEKGSELYEQITQLPEYYPYREEHRLLQLHATEIASHIPAGSVVVELGCGDGSKTALLLCALMQRDGAEGVNYVGIDCSAGALAQLQRNLQRLLPELSSYALLEAEFLAGVADVRQQHPDACLCLVWLGSSVGNWSHEEAADLLRSLRAVAGSNMQLLLCTDLWKDAGTLCSAYNDSTGVTEQFIQNGMQHALRTLGHPAAGDSLLFKYDVNINAEKHQVEMYLVAQRRLPDLLPGLHLEAGERLLMEISRKFTPDCIRALALDSGLCLEATWASRLYSMQMLLPPEAALQRAWADSDGLFACVANWSAQPIPLRHPFCFYVGHCPAFTKLKLVPQEAEEPADVTFSRGIDPNVLDPGQCHSHPDVPASWPGRAELERYVSRVRQCVLDAIHAGSVDMRAVAMCLEHERMHQETLCHMIAVQRKLDWEATKQGAGAAGKGCSSSSPVITGPKPSRSGSSASGAGAFPLNACPYAAAALEAPRVEPAADSPGPEEPSTPDYHSFSRRFVSYIGGFMSSSQEAASSAAAAPEAERAGTVGSVASKHAAAEHSSSPQACVSGCVRVPGGQVWLGVDRGSRHGFLWDNELGRQGPLEVPELLVGARPVTVRDFRDFILRDKGYQRRELWDGASWGLLCSQGWRLPALWSQDASRGQIWVHMPEASYCWQEVADCPAYVSLCEAEAYCRLHGGRVMAEAEYAHLSALAASGSCSVDQLESGGWEWTATPLAPFPGFQPDPLYPEYSADFFDGRHYVMKGCSPYTHPSMRRASFRNFYQPEYRTVLAKFRLVRDAA